MSTEGPLVSVVVPCWNSARTIGETLACLQAQTFPLWEVVVIDDGSTDESAQMIRTAADADSRIRMIRQPNAGLPSARNRGLEEARGLFVVFLDSDDLISPGKLARHVESAPDSRTILYGGSTYFLDKTRGPAGLAMKCTASGGPSEMLPWLARENIMPVSAAFLPLALVRAVGGFDARLHAFEDWDFWLRCARAGASFRFDASPDAQTQIRVRPGSMSSDTARMFDWEMVVRMKHHDLPEMRTEFARLRRFHLKAAVANLVKGNLTMSSRHACYSLPLPILRRRARRASGC